MKPLNFTYKEKLPYLLNLKPGDELQTIRKTWEEGRVIRNGEAHEYIKRDKPSQYKVGDEVDMWWNFDCSYYGENKDLYGPAKLGKIKVTEIFEIEMGTGTIKNYKQEIEKTGYIALCNEKGTEWKNIEEDLATRDGFKSAEDMFKYFDDNYDLSTPKKFRVTRGVVL